MQAEIKLQLQQLAEEKYRIFSCGLLPNTEHILGVRIPSLRKMAKNLAKNDWQVYLRTAQEDSFEEIMLQGMVIGLCTCPAEEKLLYIRQFVPKIDNWSVCDSFCSGLKFTKTHMDLMWDFLQPYFSSDREFDVRFAVVMLHCYYIDTAHIDAVLDRLNTVSHQGYYAKMAVAWALSTCYIKLPQPTEPFLQHNSLDDFTYNKALQKITESFQVPAEEKQRIRAMRRS